jgi:hypothetical protein
MYCISLLLSTVCDRYVCVVYLDQSAHNEREFEECIDQGKGEKGRRGFGACENVLDARRKNGEQRKGREEYKYE